MIRLAFIFYILTLLIAVPGFFNAYGYNSPLDERLFEAAVTLAILGSLFAIAGVVFE